MKASIGRTLALAAGAVALIAALALASPAFRLSYVDGVPRAELLGNYVDSRYVVLRADQLDGPYEPITVGDVLCLGACYADDAAAAPGRVYWYRFDLLTAAGEHVSFGPYQAAIDPRQTRRMSLAIEPNPSRGEARITVSLAGSSAASVEVEGALFDVRGRRLRDLHRGALGAGSTVVRWDGHDSEGRLLAAGTYFLRFIAADGRQAVTRLVRVR